MRTTSYPLYRFPYTHQQLNCICASFALALVAVWPAFAQGISAQPSYLRFDARDQSVTVNLSRNGLPVPALAIRGFELFASGNTYHHMLSMTKRDGSVTFTPTSSCEIGTYDLVIYTSYGEVHVDAHTPLSTIPSVLEQSAAAQGVPIEVVKEQFGMAGSSGPEILHIRLPNSIHVGEILLLQTAAAPDHDFEWRVNGAVAAAGRGVNAVSYIVETPGRLVIEHRQSDRGVLVAHATAETYVIPEPGVPWTIPRNAEATLPGPEGFTEYQWSFNGDPIATTRTVRFLIKRPGTYDVTCKAMNPTAPSNYRFREITYNISVAP